MAVRDAGPRDADTPIRGPAGPLRFGRHALDLERGCLLADGNEVALRPKTFAVLRHLVENAGRLVSKDELFAVVWPRSVVTDDALVQSVGELRRALGDDGGRLVRTVPRRGYRFEAEVSSAPADRSGARFPAATSAPMAGPASARMRLGAIVATIVVSLAILLAAVPAWRGVETGRGPAAPSVDGERAAPGGPEAGAGPAIAVLPLVDDGGDAGRAYFADGLTQDIIEGLGRFSALTVVSWNAVLPYRDRAASPQQIGRGLAVRYLVEGSLRRVDERIQVVAQLTDTRLGRVLWSARFDEAQADVFALQDELTARIVGALAIRVTEVEQRRVLAKPTASLEAYDHVLRARPALQRPTRAAIAEARKLLGRAIEMDPGYAAAHAALAETYYVATSMGWAESPSAFMARAEELALQAVGLDHADVRARVLLGRIHLFHRRYAPADAELAQAVAINPNDAHGLAGRGNILMWSGRADAAIELLERARRIDPELNPMDRFALSLAYYLQRRYDTAIEQAELDLRGASEAGFSRIVLAAAYAQSGRGADAARVATVIRRTDPTFDARDFGTKFLNVADLEHLREGLRKAGFEPGRADGLPPRR